MTADRTFRSYACQHEGCTSVADAPMLHDHIWAKVGSPTDLYCLEHTEQRLGREVEPHDLNESPGNTYAKTFARRHHFL